MANMQGLARILSYVSALLGALTLIRPRSGWMTGVLLAPKLLAGAWAPCLGLAGTLGALVGLGRGDLRAAGAGLFGALVATRHVVRVSAPHAGFEQAFGPNWPSRIPPTLQTRLLGRRYTPILPPPPDVPWERDVAFGTHLDTDDPLLCDMWQPPEGVPRTGLGIIYLHGSGWHYLDKDTGTRPFFRRLAGQGHVVMDVAYTLAPEAHMDLMLADVKRAITWMKARSSEYGVDPERVVLMGGSAGGHLALLAAYTPNLPQFQPADIETDTGVRAVVSFYGPPDLEALHDDFQVHFRDIAVGRWEPLYVRLGLMAPEDVGKIATPADMVRNPLGGGPDQVPDRYRRFSPINHVGPHCPPSLLLQGAHDATNMTPAVRRLHNDLLEAGAVSIYVEFPDTEHGFDLFFPRWSPAAQAATYDTERFLALMV